MYESKETSIRGIIITILLIILVVCILIWIFPTKKDIKGISGANNEPLLNEIFGRNLRVLQNAGRAYYYSANLPKNVGDSTSITLGELVDKKMLLELNDKNGKKCNNNDSYVQLTKKADGQYEMKSYLSCDSDSDYILENLTCSNFKNNCQVKKETSKNDKKSENQPKPDNNEKDSKSSESSAKKTTPTVVTYYRYLYRCPKTTTEFSAWSSWSKNYVSDSSTRVVDTKVEYENKYVKTGTKQEPVTTYETVQTYETIEEEKSYVNTKPSNATNCVTVPRTGYTLYKCKVTTQKLVTKQEPKTTYNTVDVYDWVSTPVTYYRYKTLVSNKTYTETWSTNSNDTTYKNMGCTVIKSEKVTK